VVSPIIFKSLQLLSCNGSPATAEMVSSRWI
jgi:hypothetical protein